jgi:hypothetical protein
MVVEKARQFGLRGCPSSAFLGVEQTVPTATRLGDVDGAEVVQLCECETPSTTSA